MITTTLIFWLTFLFNHVIWNVCTWLFSYLVTWSAKFDSITWAVRVRKMVLLIKSTYQTWCLSCKIGEEKIVSSRHIYWQRGTLGSLIRENYGNKITHSFFGSCWNEIWDSENFNKKIGLIYQKVDMRKRN